MTFQKKHMSHAWANNTLDSCNRMIYRTMHQFDAAVTASVPAGGPFIILLPAGGPFMFSRLVRKTSVPVGGLIHALNATADVSLQVLSQLSFCSTRATTAHVLDRGCGRGESCVLFFS